MKKAGLILALVLIAFATWSAITYATVEDKLRDIAERLPSEQALNAMPLDQTLAALKVAKAQCNRLYWLKIDPLARLLRGDEIKSLAEHCELIEGRQDSLQGP
jgi:hypothetical protein